MSSPRRRESWVVAAMFGMAGVSHFVAPSYLRPVVPPWLAAGARPLVAATGVAELIVSGAVLHPATRRGGAYGAAGLIATFLVAHVDAAARTRRDRPRWIERPVGVTVRLVVNAGLLAWTVAVARRNRVGTGPTGVVARPTRSRRLQL